jgi:Ca2+-binding RTX toxin-like protein
VTLSGGAGDDYLIGSLGRNYLDGGAGSDILIGTDGSATYVIDSLSDQISETYVPFDNEENPRDKIISSISISLTEFFEDLTFLVAMIFKVAVTRSRIV